MGELEVVLWKIYGCYWELSLPGLFCRSTFFHGSGYRPDCPAAAAPGAGVLIKIRKKVVPMIKSVK